MRKTVSDSIVTRCSAASSTPAKRPVYIGDQKLDLAIAVRLSTGVAHDVAVVRGA
jgi:hypothetical protein